MTTLGRRHFLQFGLASLAALGLSACGSNEGAVTDKLTGQLVITPDDFAKLIAKGPVASDDLIANSPWAKAIKESGKLRWGGIDTNPFFSLKDITSGAYLGFDAGIVQLLARYIIGEAKFEFQGVTSDTRETLLQNKTVDVVVATYSITPERKQKIALAGPYFSSGVAVLVPEDSPIKSIDELDGKKIIMQNGSSTIKLVSEKFPKAEHVLFTSNAECVTGLRQARGDAYLVDQAILLGVVKREAGFKIIGGTLSFDPYGIGLNKEIGDVKFVNAFLSDIFASGLWLELWQKTIGTVVKEQPTPPKLEA